MPRYFLHLAYRGAPYCGWQEQPNAPSVQAAVEQAIFTLTRTPLKITGAGRTDTGVNAAMMLAHADLPHPIDDADGMRRSLGALLRPDIVVRDIIAVHPEAHARFDATARTYRYYAHTSASPFIYPLSWAAPPRLDFDAMNEAAALLPSVSDFASFAKLHSDAKTTICRLDSARWTQYAPDRWYFEIKADRFLRNMVRAVVGTLADVGRHKLTLNDFREVVAARNRCAAGTSMPPHPLFLWHIDYPYLHLAEPEM